MEKPRIITKSTPTRPSTNFEGREKELGDIKVLSKDKVVLISGLGGIGKTEICRKLFWDYVNNGDTEIKNIGWINLTNGIQSFIGEFHELENTGSNSDLIAIHINGLGDKLLLFIDNADEVKGKSKEIDWITSLNCRMIMTSRIDIGSRTETYTIDQLPIEECLSLYRKNRKDNLEAPFEDDRRHPRQSQRSERDYSVSHNRQQRQD